MRYVYKTQKKPKSEGLSGFYGAYIQMLVRIKKKIGSIGLVWPNCKMDIKDE